jgi:hypothetical protein
MTLWKQQLLNCPLAADVSLETLTLLSCALGGAMVQLPETVWKIVFPEFLTVTLSRCA